MKNNLVKVGILLLLGLIFFGGQWAYRAGYIDFAALKNNKAALESIVAYNYPLAACIYVLIYVVSIITLLPIGSLLSLAGGFLFGTWAGVLLVNISATVGAVLVVTMLRYVFRDALQTHKSPALITARTMLEKHGAMYLLALRFVVIIPFFVVNIAAALTRIPLWTIAWTTSVGVMPASFLLCSAGNQLEQVDTISDLFTWKMGLVFGLLAMLMLLPLLFKRIGWLSQE